MTGSKPASVWLFGARVEASPTPFPLPVGLGKLDLKWSFKRCLLNTTRQGFSKVTLWLYLASGLPYSLLCKVFLCPDRPRACLYPVTSDAQCLLSGNSPLPSSFQLAQESGCTESFLPGLVKWGGLARASPSERRQVLVAGAESWRS